MDGSIVWLKVLVSYTCNSFRSQIVSKVQYVSSMLLHASMSISVSTLWYLWAPVKPVSLWGTVHILLSYAQLNSSELEIALTAILHFVVTLNLSYKAAMISPSVIFHFGDMLSWLNKWLRQKHRPGITTGTMSMISLPINSIPKTTD